MAYFVYLLFGKEASKIIIADGLDFLIEAIKDDGLEFGLFEFSKRLILQAYFLIIMDVMTIRLFPLGNKTN
jgi:hypothetical protein